MSRAIKFRVWNNFQKKYNTLQYEALNGTIRPIDNNLNCSKECILEQFTSLKDKNGVDVYEGDFLSNGVIPIEFKGYEVFYEDGAFQIAYSDGWDTYGGDQLLCETNLKHYEVIGNIHIGENID